MEYIGTIIAILTAIGGVYSAFNKIRTTNAVQDEKIQNLKSEVYKLEMVLEKHKDKMENKINAVFCKMDEHYKALDKKIDDLRTLITERL